MRKFEEDMYDLDEICFERTYDTLDDIDLREELEKRYKSYPRSVVFAFLRSGANTVQDMKNHFDDLHHSKWSVRNVGPARNKVAKKLVKKYEDEDIRRTP